MYRAMEGLTIRNTPLPPGDTGTRMTVGAMQQLVAEGLSNPIVRSYTTRILDAAGALGHDAVRQAQALFNFVRDQIAFLNDPVGVEMVQAPQVTLARGTGDCDDRAILLRTMLNQVGIPARFKVTASNPRFPESFTHVYVEAYVMGQWVALDPTYADNVPGTEPPHIFRTWVVQ